MSAHERRGNHYAAPKRMSAFIRGGFLVERSPEAEADVDGLWLASAILCLEVLAHPTSIHRISA